MKFWKGKIIFALFALVLIILPIFVFGDVDIATKLENPLSATSLFCFLKDILDVFLTIGVIIAVLFMVYAGFMYVTARGDTAKLSAAHKAFLGAVIGTAIIMGVWVIANAIVGTINAIRPGTAEIKLDCP